MRHERDSDPSSPYQAKLKTIARSILGDKCMFFLGAGASLGGDPSLPTAAKLSEEMAGECNLDFRISSVVPRTSTPSVQIAAGTTQVGAGTTAAETVSQPAATQPSLPTPANLSQEMADACQLDWYDYIPLSTIAFYYESRFTREELDEFLVRHLRRPEIPPSPTIYKLVELIKLMEAKQKTTFTITTNYDDQFERAYREKFNNREPETIIYKGAHDPHDRDARLNSTPKGPLQREAQYWKPEGPTVLYKMHGCILQPQNKGLVITEEDYINFLTNALNDDDHEKTLLNYIKGELGYRTIVFIGYSLSDWNFRAIFKATVEKHKDRDSRSYAVQFRNPAQPMTAFERARLESTTTFWHDKKVDILIADAHDFINDLLKVVREQGGFPPEQGAFHATA